jgi:oxygen-dependent protoporphyrinogen oxidase
MEQPLDALVIGGGISGLACLWRLRRLGLRAACVEAGDHVGGTIGSERRDGFLVERAASSIAPSAELLELIRELGLESKLVEASPKLPRFVYRGGRLHGVPFGLLGALRSGLLSVRGKCRLAAEPWIAPRRDGGEESVASFIERRFGGEVLEAVVAPYINGTFGGDAACLSVQAVFPTLAELETRYGSVIRGFVRRGRANDDGGGSAKRPLISFVGGLSTLPHRLHELLGEHVLTAARADRLEKRDRFRVSIRDREGVRQVSAEAVVLATPPLAAATLLSSLSRDAGSALEEFQAPPLACVSLGWHRREIEHPLRGFGFLAAPGERIRILGCFWPSSVFPDRAPSGHVAMTAFIGGARDREGGFLDERSLVEIAKDDLGRIVGAAATAQTISVQRHAHAIPQYTIGHVGRVQRIRRALAGVPGLFVTGNFLSGIGIGDCVREAVATAKDVTEFLRLRRDSPTQPFG